MVALIDSRSHRLTEFIFHLNYIKLLIFKANEDNDKAKVPEEFYFNSASLVCLTAERDE